MPGDEGTIWRDGDDVVVEVTGGSESRGDQPGVTCANPNALPEDRVYRKVFTQKPIYLSDEYDRAVTGHLTGLDVVVLAMNGYSRLTDDQCRDWGVHPGAYEAACKALFVGVISSLQREFPGVDVRIAHGASDMGIDRVAIEVSRRFNRMQLGHSCPKFMLYVVDDDVPVYVAATQEAYAKAFIDSLTILIAANGRAQSFEHDIQAAFSMLKHVVLVNVLKSISSTSGPPGINAEGEIEDAVAAMDILVHSIEAGRSTVRPDDPFSELCDRTSGVLIGITRSLLTPKRAYLGKIL